MDKSLKLITMLLSLVLAACSAPVTSVEIAYATQRCINNGGLHRIDVDAIFHESYSDITCVDGAEFSNNAQNHKDYKIFDQKVK